MSDDDKPTRDHLKPFQFAPGQSGNPSGKPKGLERRVRELLGDDIDAIVYVQRCVALGVPPDVDEMIALGVKLTDTQRKAIANTFSTITRRDSNEAAKLVTDRGWGKAKQHVEINDKPSNRRAQAMRPMSDAELRALAKLDEGLEGDGGSTPTQH